MTNKRTKRLQTALAGGIGANVVDGDLQFAIKHWKQELKRSNKMVEIFERREYVKPSRIKKDMLSRAIHKQKVISKLEK